MKKNSIENKIDKGINIEFQYKEIDEKINYEAKKGAFPFKWLFLSITIILLLALAIIVYVI